MSPLMRYWHTLRHLRAVQFYGRVWFKVYRPKIDHSPAPALSKTVGSWLQPAYKEPNLLEAATFKFLNETHTLRQSSDWDDERVDKLWRYNLHYFDDLGAPGAEARKLWHCDLMTRWVAENPPGRGTGWEPYPTSLRMVNWIKWSLAGHGLPPSCRSSLAVQARWLSRRLEIHLLGNHLFTNAKALVFVGLFFEGKEASCWLEQGLRLLAREIPEQILPDGGHFERSPMYHALALEDLLDLCNATAAFKAVIPASWQSLIAGWPEVAARMGRWLTGMCHPDGQLSFFNDAAMGIAPSLAELEGYAQRLGLAPFPRVGEGLTHFSATGYIRIEQGPVSAFLDVAPIGPAYLPGHGHADTLSFEWSLFGQRVLVNSGVSCYGSGPQRLRQRGTAAHNTVILDDADSSEVWGGFRVARRATPRVIRMENGANTLQVVACHDGYRRLKGHNIHQRSWTVQEGCLVVEDEISGPFHRAQARFHLHPGVRINGLSEQGHEVELELPSGRKLGVVVEGGTLGWEASSWHRTFGSGEPSSCLVVHLSSQILRTVFQWRVTG